MQKFNLKQFLKTYQPKNTSSITDQYLLLPKLKGYALYSKDIELVQCQTYIMLVKISDVYNSVDLNNIRPGGILLSGGVSPGGSFKSNLDYTKWTHLLLKYDKIDSTSNIYQINVSKYYIFYKIFENKNDSKKKMFIELLKL